MFRTLLLAGATCLAATTAFAQTPVGKAEIFDLNGQSLGTLDVGATEGGGLRFTGELMGVPAGTHGVHVHETGDCDAAGKFESAGAHANPESRQHGMENPQGPHAGDLPNLEASATGAAIVDVHSDGLLADDSAAGVFDADGAALVIHADADDHMTDPSGNSGDRIACGVIEAATP